MHIPTLNNEQMAAAGLTYWYLVTYDKLATGERGSAHCNTLQDALAVIKACEDCLYLYNNFNITALMEPA